MERFRIVIIASILAVLGAILPIFAAFYISWSIAIGREQAQLERVAEYAIMRARSAFNDATKALKAADRLRISPCSLEHLAAMRTIVVRTHTVEDLDYFDGGRLKCSSWGTPEDAIARSAIDFTDENGVSVTARLYPQISDGAPMMAFRFGPYNALTDPSRFVDVLAGPEIRLAVAAKNGTVVASLNKPDMTLVQKLVAKPQTGSNEAELFATAEGDGWTAVATSPRQFLAMDLNRERLLLLPVGAIVAVLMVGLVLWLSRRRLSPLGELWTGVQRREFLVHYQPIVEMKTGICVGAEALVRWLRPDGEMIRPDHFIPLAEESGLIREITGQVIENVVADLKEVLVADRSLHIAINLAAEDIHSGSVLAVIQAALKGTGILPKQIWLEATERGFMDLKQARATIEEARRLGHSVSIDDFGTGYSSLQYLQDLPLDALKIDKSFIDTVGTDSATSTITPHIIDIAKSLALDIVAEGVERKEQADYLVARGVQYGQGWLFAKPMPAAQFIAFYRDNKR